MRALFALLPALIVLGASAPRGAAAQGWSPALAVGPARRIGGQPGTPALGSITLGVYRGAGAARLGLEVGYHRYEDWELARPGVFYFDPATETEYLCPPDCDAGIPTTVREARTSTALQATAQLRLQAAGRGTRPYATLGLGLYAYQERYRWVRRGPTGIAIQQLATGSGRDLAAGGNLGLGLLLPLGRDWRVDVGGRLHGFAVMGNDYVGGGGIAALTVGIARR